jgi:ACS family tartrate transporter-like MFS transporter
MADVGKEDRIQTQPKRLMAGVPSEAAVLVKVGLRLLPFLFLMYVMNILDRVNVGFARLQMFNDLGLEGDYGERVYGFGAGIFYIGYLIFEIPSNLILHRIGARIWIGRILISWGVISAAMLFVKEPWSFYTLRFLLGVAEAGFFPGIILYLSYWFPTRERAKAVALFMIASPVAGIIGSPVSGAILDRLNGTAGLGGWQWLFLLEGVPTIFLGIITWFYLTDRPEQARWLTPAERDWLSARMSGEEARRTEHHRLHRLSAMAVPRVWLLIALYSTIAVGANSYGLHAPKIIAGLFPDRRMFEIGLIVALPSLAGMIGMIVFGIHSDRTGERCLHVSAAAFMAAIGWGFAALAWAVTPLGVSPWLVVAGLSLAQVGMMGMLPCFWAIPTAFLSGTAAAGGIALINSVANLGGFVGPYVISDLKARTGGYTEAMLVMAATLFAGTLLALCVRHDPKHDQH